MAGVQITKIESVVVFASYNESENLLKILNEFGKNIPKQTAIIIADDSLPIHFEKIKIMVDSLPWRNQKNIKILHSEYKAGRGAAVRRGFSYAIKNFPYCKIFVEADSDGSHRIADILTVLETTKNHHFVIGSRYLQQSQIIGWNLGRRLLSRFLNMIIPKVMGLRCTDITNGLRGYSRDSIMLVLNANQKNTGFIYLSEVADLLAKNQIESRDIPIKFEERVHGQSSVGIREVHNSLIGILRLYVSKGR
jgi:dolichol-phosphate mannosyltransferase